MGYAYEYAIEQASGIPEDMMEATQADGANVIRQSHWGPFGSLGHTAFLADNTDAVELMVA